MGRKSAKDVSLLTFLIFCTDVILWFIYGLRIGSLPVNFADLITLILAEAILLIKLKHGWRG